MMLIHSKQSVEKRKIGVCWDFAQAASRNVNSVCWDPVIGRIRSFMSDFDEVEGCDGAFRFFIYR